MEDDYTCLPGGAAFNYASSISYMGRKILQSSPTTFKTGKTQVGNKPYWLIIENILRPDIIYMHQKQLIDKYGVPGTDGRIQMLFNYEQLRVFFKNEADRTMYMLGINNAS